ncbi:ATP-binding protein [Cytobacillus praedii]|uniref:Magnesium chelatase n=1 Tax=Cytobacillus praedii TaxID=1742358 RepID=A0A4R1B271_9BACI|nr:AAA family ATPase [Cytobacillus praedii]TCJ05362.1 magnesium chelatase [Cytobacillus praedii]
MVQHKLYPLTAIVGQDNMKLALILNVINPTLGGVLIRGEKGTAKSTAVRALAEIIPSWAMNEEYVSASLKVIDLPISATEDRVVGTIDVEYAIKTGEKKFEPGILAEAHNQILYVDEVNLLEDHIVDVLLDAAAMGVNVIEREGISHSHPAKFILVGTMNPEEGDLRPQLLDRFALSVEVYGEKELSKRMEVIQRRLQFEDNPDIFIERFNDDQHNLRNSILSARDILKDVVVSDQLIEMAVKIAIMNEVEGHRCDITMIKTAITIAAFENRTKVNVEDISRAATLVVPHRLKRKPFEKRTFDTAIIESVINSYQVLQ